MADFAQMSVWLDMARPAKQAVGTQETAAARVKKAHQILSEIACVPTCDVCCGLNEKANIVALGAVDHAEEWPAPMEYVAGLSRSEAEWLALDAHVETILDAIAAVNR